MDAGTHLLLLWIAVALGWLLPVWFLAHNAVFVPLWPALLYLAMATGVTIVALVWTFRGFLRGD
jgi:CHASE2 domain-containing sensor protein